MSRSTPSTTEPFRPVSADPARSRRPLRWAAGAALLACVGPALAGAGAGLLNAVATLRGHQSASDVAYGPLPRQRFDVYVPGNALAQADRKAGSPLVIFFYGGSWNSGSRRDYRFAGAALHDKLVHPEQNSIALADRMKARGTAVTFRTYEHVNHALLIGSLSWPLTAFAPVLDDTAAFIRDAAPVATASPVAAASR